MSQATGTSTTAIRNATIVTMDGERNVFENADILIRGDLIESIGPSLDAADEEIDGSGCFVIPGLISTHESIWWTALRGGMSTMIEGEYRGADNPKPFVNLREIMRPRDVYAGVKAGALGQLASGVTTALTYTHCLKTEAHHDSVVKALRESGLRAKLGAGVGDKPGGYFRDLAHRLEVLSRVKEDLRDDDRVGLMIALGGLHSGIDRTAEECNFARENGLRITWHNNDSGEVLQLHEAGLLGEDMIPVHSTPLLPEELDLLAEVDATISITPVPEFAGGRYWGLMEDAIQRGVRVTLGNDNPAFTRFDLFEEMRLALSIQLNRERIRERVIGRAPSRRPGLPLLEPEDMMEMSTINGARALGMQDSVGSLEPGKQADLVMLTTGMFGPAMGSPAVHLVHYSGVEDVDTVLVGGKVVKRNGRMLDIDEEELRADLRAAREWTLSGSADPDDVAKMTW